MRRLPRARGRHRLPRHVGRRARLRVRRGRLHDRDDRLPGDRHRPELRRAGRLLHGADGRQLRRRARAERVRPRPRARRRHARGARARLDRLARTHSGVVALSEIDTRSLVLHLRGARLDALRDRRPARARSTRRWPAPSRSPRWPAARWPPASRPRSRTSSPRGGRASVAVVDYGVKRSILDRLAAAGAGVTVYPARRRRRRARPPRRGAPLERAGRPERARGRGRGDPRAARPRAGARHLPRPPAARAARSTSRRSSCPFGHRGANHPVLERRTSTVLVTCQNHGFAVAPTEAREATPRLALRRHRRGPRPCRRSRPARCSSIRRPGPGPHDARHAHRRVGGRSEPCQSGLSSVRSA